MNTPAHPWRIALSPQVTILWGSKAFSCFVGVTRVLVLLTFCDTHASERNNHPPKKKNLCGTWVLIATHRDLTPARHEMESWWIQAVYAGKDMELSVVLKKTHRTDPYNKQNRKTLQNHIRFAQNTELYRTTYIKQTLHNHTEQILQKHRSDVFI